MHSGSIQHDNKRNNEEFHGLLQRIVTLGISGNTYQLTSNRIYPELTENKKKMCKYIEELTVLQSAYAAMNQHYFGNKLPPVIITIQSDLKAYGHYTPREVWVTGEAEDKATYHEINFSAETLKRHYHNTCATLMHEMVHHYCHCNQISDTSRQGRYHNKEFKRIAEEKGLSISYSKTIGWSVTDPTEKFKDFIDSLGLDFKKLYRDTAVTEPTERKQSPIYKHECPVCGLKIRTNKAGAMLQCMVCNEPLKEY